MDLEPERLQQLWALFLHISRLDVRSFLLHRLEEQQRECQTTATGMEAKTIHRLLEYKPPEGYQKNEEHPLEGDVLILDEPSMIDIMLMYNLLKTLPQQIRL